MKRFYVYGGLATAFVLLGQAVGQPLKSSKKEERMAPMGVDAQMLEKHVRQLAETLTPRHADHVVGLSRAADYVHAALLKTTARVADQSFTVPNDLKPGLAQPVYRNVIASFGPEAGERLVIGAHYDACGPLPGADDNASGVAGLLELARLLQQHPPAIRTDLVAYALEEPPHFGTQEMGSAIHARSLAEAKIPVRAMISLEMLGYFSDEPNSQAYPSAILKLLYPSRGNFIAVVGRFADSRLTRRVKKSMRRGGTVPVRSLNGPAWLPGVDFSDHRNYWAHGYTAVMITDTAFFRNPHYHKQTDLPETLDYVRMAQVVEGVYCAIADIGQQ